MKHKMKIGGIVFVVAVTGVLMHLYGEATVGRSRQQSIAREIIRLHVVANSDSDSDQELKGQVKETILTYLRGAMKEAATVEEARQAIRSHLRDIEEIANEKMQQEGFDYRAEASLGKCYFPVKEYGDLTFPAGDYEALRVNLGESQGQNWWCVMYPTLCFVDSTYQIVPDSSKEKLKGALTEEEYNSLLDGGEDVSYSFRILDWIQNII
ncbi:MAG: stage II sporulation protein R [Lachnospiraceae bacterium]|nr:stage II sporulation protein R [Lachnospiraceae bacterium]